MANAINSLNFGNNIYTFTLPYGTCSTAAGTAAKTVDVDNFSLETGARVLVKFTVTNTAASPTLNVESTGAKAIYYNGAAITAGYLKANKTYEFVYNGTQWDMISDVDTNTTYTFNGAVSTIKDSNLTASRALVSNGNGKVWYSAVTSTELGYLDGVTSNVQTQLDGKSASGHTHNYAGSSSAGGAATSANKVNSSLTVQLNGGTTEGTNKFTFDGSGAKSVNITPSAIGAAASSHSHSSYVNQNAFSNVTVGSTTIAADTTTDTLTLVAGSNVTITPDATNDKITIAATDTVYTHPTTAGNKHIPSGGSSGQFLKWSASGTATWAADNDTKNTAGSTDSSSKLFLIGATSQAANPQTYSHDTAYVGTDGCLYSNSTKVSVEGHTHSGYAASSHNHSASNITSGTLAVARGGTGNSNGYIQIGALSGTTVGTLATAEGRNVTASGSYCHAEGNYTEASGSSAHAEGQSSTASGIASHAEGNNATASGNHSHAEGDFTTASAKGAHVEGTYTLASSEYQHVQGKFNVEDKAGTYAHIVGNGESTSARSNAHTVDWNGNAWFKGDVYVGGTSQDDGIKLVKSNSVPALDYGSSAPSGEPTAGAGSVYFQTGGDVVVEVGTSGIWTWRKWASGIAECWGTHAVTVTHYITIGTFYGYYTDVTFPSGLFNASPIAHFSGQIGSGFMLSGTTGLYSKNDCRLYALSTSSGTNSSYWYVTVKGRWK